jgi:hypothetical protein
VATIILKPADHFVRALFVSAMANSRARKAHRGDQNRH